MLRSQQVLSYSVGILGHLKKESKTKIQILPHLINTRSRRLTVTSPIHSSPVSETCPPHQNHNPYHNRCNLRAKTVLPFIYFAHRAQGFQQLWTIPPPFPSVSFLLSVFLFLPNHRPSLLPFTLPPPTILKAVAATHHTTERKTLKTPR